MNPLKDLDDYYITVKLYDQTDSCTINELYESFKTAVKKELEDEFCEMLGKAISCPKCHRIHFKSEKCGCGLEIIV